MTNTDSEAISQLGKNARSDIEEDTNENDELAGDQFKIGNFDNVAGVAIGRSAKAVHLQGQERVGDVITADTINISNYQEIKRTRIISNRQVTPPPAPYITRALSEQHLKELLLNPPNKASNQIGLYGLPGVGKTLLARKVALELAADFPDGTLWADVGMTTPSDILWSFIEPYAPTLERNSLLNNDQALEQLQECLANKKTLIVFDQVKASEDLRELLPQNCPQVVVLTIARSLLPGITTEDNSLNLSEMTIEEAETLFRTVWGQNVRSSSEVVQELARHLYFIPAEMVVVAKQILANQVSPEDYLIELRQRTRQRQSGNLQVNPGFEIVYTNLPEAGKQLLPFVGIIGGGVWSFEALMAVSQQSQRTTEAGLRQLLVSGFVNRIAPGRFRISPVVRDFAMTKLDGIGGNALIRMSRALMARFFLDRYEQIARQFRRLLLKDFLVDEILEEEFIQELVVLLAQRDESGAWELDPSLLKIDPGVDNVDPIQVAFEKLVLRVVSYAKMWNASFNTEVVIDLTPQLEEAMDWAIEIQDWELVRRFALCNLGSYWDGLSLNGREKDNDWITFELKYGSIYNSRITNFQIINTNLKAVHIVIAHWSDCELVNSSWMGVHCDTVHFSNIDMIGAVLPGLVVTFGLLIKVDLRHADLRGAVFNRCKFTDVNFRNANMEKVKFVNCAFERVDFRGTVFDRMSPTSGWFISGDFINPTKRDAQKFSGAITGLMIPIPSDVYTVFGDVLTNNAKFNEMWRELWSDKRARHLSQQSHRIIDETFAPIIDMLFSKGEEIGVLSFIRDRLKANSNKLEASQKENLVHVSSDFDYLVSQLPDNKTEIRRLFSSPTIYRIIERSEVDASLWWQKQFTDMVPDLTKKTLDELFAPLVIVAKLATQDSRSSIVEVIQKLKKEISKASQMDDTVIFKLLENLVSLLPSETQIIKGTITYPPVAKWIGPETRRIIESLDVVTQADSGIHIGRSVRQIASQT